jgi:hypothetical protein
MFLYRNFLVSAAPDIVLWLKVQRPWHLPYQERYSPVYVLSLTPALRDRNKHFCSLKDVPLNNQKDVFARLFFND